MGVAGGFREGRVFAQLLRLIVELVAEAPLDRDIALDIADHRHVALPIQGWATCSSIVVSTLA